MDERIQLEMMLSTAKGTIEGLKETTHELRDALAKTHLELEQRSKRMLDASEDAKYRELQVRCDRYANLLQHIGLTTTELPQLSHLGGPANAREALIQIAKESRRITELTFKARKHDKEIVTMKHRLRKE